MLQQQHSEHQRCTLGTICIPCTAHPLHPAFELHARRLPSSVSVQPRLARLRRRRAACDQRQRRVMTGRGGGGVGHELFGGGGGGEARK